MDDARDRKPGIMLGSFGVVSDGEGCGSKREIGIEVPAVVVTLRS